MIAGPALEALKKKRDTCKEKVEGKGGNAEFCENALKDAIASSNNNEAAVTKDGGLSSALGTSTL